MRSQDSIEKEFLKTYDDFSNAIFRYCFLRVTDKDLAYDILQETFIKTWDYLAKGNEIRNYRAFLYKTARNLIIDEYRKKRIVPLSRLQEKGFDARLDNRPELFNEIQFKEIIDVISLLKPEYRDPLLMRYVDDLPVKEIAEIMQETENNISVRLHRGLKHLKEILNNDKRI